MSGQNKIFKYKDLCVKFETDTIIKILNDTLSVSSNEIGGILTGTYENNNSIATIKTFHLPPTDSIIKRFSFVRGVSGLTAKLRELWEKNEYYLGEWHLHPYATPTASSTDINQLLSISKQKDYKCPEPIMIIASNEKNNYKFNVYLALNNTVIKLEELE